MQFEYTEAQTPMEQFFGGFYHISAFGKINAGDGARFRNFLELAKPPPIATVYLNTQGGSVPDGIEIGRLIRRYSLTTSIGTYLLAPPTAKDSLIRKRVLKPGACASSGTLAFLGGRFRFLPEGSKFLVHQFRYDKMPDDVLGPSQQTSAAIASYLEKMGISQKLLEVSAQVPHSTARKLSREELIELRVINNGVADALWTTEARNNTFYIKGERDSIYGVQKIMLGHMKPNVFYFHAVFESQNRDNELTNFPLVELTMKDENIRIDISSRCLRHIINRHMNIWVNLSQQEARQLVDSRGFGVQVRASSGADLFFGVRDMPIDNGGMEKMETLLSMFSK